MKLPRPSPCVSKTAKYKCATIAGINPKFNRKRGTRMTDSGKPIPTQIELHQKSHVLEIAFSDGKHFSLPYEFLRVYSPSAEVRGHGPGQETLQVGKKEVEIKTAEPVGTYAMQLAFSD